MADPRNPVRPSGGAGATWCRCGNCGREAARLTLIRHRKGCIWREEAAAAARRDDLRAITGARP